MLFTLASIATLLLSASPCIAVPASYSASSASPSPAYGSPGFPSSPPKGQAPPVRVGNGTYNGVHDSVHNQDYYLGMPYAQPPVGTLRLNFPQSLNSSWKDIRSAENFGPVCVGYGPDNNGYQNSEDCLTINVFRPSGYYGQPLPVGFWIYGGGFNMGSGSAPQYNMSAILKNSVDVQKPIITVTFNYRLSGWGFMYSDEIQQAGTTNLGLRDTRLALRWIQENIGAFGGDPSKVTIWGESAGAGIVGAQSLAFGGRDDKLFRGMISESGPPLQPGLYPPPLANAVFANITRDTGCGDAADKIACLRALPFATLNNELNRTMPYTFLPAVDGDFIPEITSSALSAGHFTRTPLLIGTNSDEGTFFGPRGINTDAEFRAFVNSTMAFPTDAAIEKILKLYPDDPSVGLPATLPFRPNATVGTQYKRSTAYTTDYFMLAGRRYSNEKWTQFHVPNYAYRFNVKPNGADIYTGVTHYVEVQFVYDNVNGYGVSPSGFKGEPDSYKSVAEVMSKMWVSFIHDLDPNYSQKGEYGVPDWPEYSMGNPRDFVFDANVTGLATVEADTFRGEAVRYINQINPSVYGR